MVESLGVGGVQLDALAGEQVLVDRVAGQRVPECVAAARAVDDEQRRVDDLAQCLVQLRGRHVGHLGEQPLRHPPAGHGGGPQQPLGGRGEPLRAVEQHVAQRRRQLLLRAALANGADQLLDEEGVALGCSKTTSTIAASAWCAQDPGHLGGDLRPVEPLQLHPVHAALGAPSR